MCNCCLLLLILSSGVTKITFVFSSAEWLFRYLKTAIIKSFLRQRKVIFLSIKFYPCPINSCWDDSGKTQETLGILSDIPQGELRNLMQIISHTVLSQGGQKVSHPADPPLALLHVPWKARRVLCWQLELFEPCGFLGGLEIFLRRNRQKLN